jgi:hypothetical protein
MEQVHLSPCKSVLVWAVHETEVGGLALQGKKEKGMGQTGLG